MEENCETCECYATCPIYNARSKIQHNCEHWIPQDAFTKNIRDNEDYLIDKLNELIGMADKILENIDNKK